MKAKVSFTPKPKQPRKFCSEMNEREVAIITACKTYPEYVGKLIAKTYHGFILLDDFEVTWAGNPHFEVNILPKGTKVEITF